MAAQKESKKCGYLRKNGEEVEEGEEIEIEEEEQKLQCNRGGDAVGIYAMKD